MSPAPTKPAPTTPDVNIVQWDKTFSYPCWCCKITDHWTKDCPHHFDIHYLSTDKLQKVLDNRWKAEGLPPLSLLRGKDNTAPIEAFLPLSDSKMSPTLSTHSLKKDPHSISDPLSSAPIKTPAPSQCPIKEWEIVRPTSPLPTLGPHLTHHIPTLHLVDPPYIPLNLQTCQNISRMPSCHAQQSNPNNHSYSPWRRPCWPLYSAQTTPYVPPTQWCHPSPLWQVIWKASTLFNDTFIISLPLCLDHHLSISFAFHLPQIYPYQKSLFQIYPLFTMDNKSNASPSIVTWWTKCCLMHQKQRDTNTLLIQDSGMIPLSRFTRTSISISIIQRISTK